MTRYDQLADKIDGAETIDRVMYGAYDAVNQVYIIAEPKTGQKFASYDYATKVWTISNPHDDHTHELVKAICRSDNPLLEKLSVCDAGVFVERIAISLIEHDVWQEPEIDIVGWMYNSGWTMSAENMRRMQLAKRLIEKLANG